VLACAERAAVGAVGAAEPESLAFARLSAARLGGDGDHDAARAQARRLLATAAARGGPAREAREALVHLHVGVAALRAHRLVDAEDELARAATLAQRSRAGGAALPADLPVRRGDRGRAVRPRQHLKTHVRSIYLPQARRAPARRGAAVTVARELRLLGAGPERSVA
jgi:hypothetical protein